MFELQREKRTEAIDRKYSQHREQAKLNTLISKLEALFLGTKNGLVEFGQVLDVDRLLAAFVIIELELVDKAPNTLGLSARFKASQKVAHSIDFFAVFVANFPSIDSFIVAPKQFIVESEGARFPHTFQMSTVFSLFELETEIEKPMNVAWCHLTNCLFGDLPLGQCIGLFIFDLTVPTQMSTGL